MTGSSVLGGADLPQPPPGCSASYADGWADALAGDPMPPGVSPAYATGYTDALDTVASTGN